MKHYDKWLHEVAKVLESFKTGNLDIGKWKIRDNTKIGRTYTCIYNEKELFSICNNPFENATFALDAGLIERMDKGLEVNIRNLWCFRNGSFDDSLFSSKRESYRESLIELMRNYKEIFNSLDQMVRISMAEAYELAFRGH